MKLPGTELLACDFCRKSQDDVGQIIRSGSAAICNECIDVAASITARERREKAGKADRTVVTPIGDAPANPEAITLLREIRDAIKQARTIEVRCAPSPADSLLKMELASALAAAAADRVASASQ